LFVSICSLIRLCNGYCFAVRMTESVTELMVIGCFYSWRETFCSSYVTVVRTKWKTSIQR
jgi:hypothetical protein